MPADVFRAEGAHRSPAQRHRPGGVPRPAGGADVDAPPTRCRSSGRSTRRRRWRCASTPPATGCRTTGSMPTRDADVAALLDGLGVTAADLPIAITQRGLLKRATPGRARLPARDDRRRAARTLLRRRRRRRRTGGLAASVYARVRGPAHADGRRGGGRRPGRHELAHRELPRVPDRHLGPGPRDPGVDPGPEVRRGHHQPVRRGVARRRRRAHRRHACRTAPRSAGGPSSPRPAPTTASCPSTGSSATRWPACTTPRPSWRPGCAPARTSSSSAAATRPGRRRCSSPRRLASVCIVVRRPLAATMSSYLVDRIDQPPARPGARRDDGHRARRRTDAGTHHRQRR